MHYLEIKYCSCAGRIIRMLVVLAGLHMKNCDFRYLCEDLITCKLYMMVPK